MKHSNSLAAMKFSIPIAALLLGAGATGPVHAHQGDNLGSNVVHACVSNKNGGVTIVGTGGTCSSSQTASHWNIVGPQGPQGEAGPPGVQGAQGPQGLPGPMPAYAHMVTVGLSADDGTNRVLTGADFTSIHAALDSIPDVQSSFLGELRCTARYLVKVLPGVYNERVTMKPCVDIEGSGELVTRITAAGGATWRESATLVGASRAELRLLTVENSGSGTFAIAVFNDDSSPRLTHVTATVSGNTGVGDAHYGVFNYFSSSPVMTNVTATATGGMSNYGVFNDSASSPVMSSVTAFGGGGNFGYGVYVTDSSTATIHGSTLSGKHSLVGAAGIWNAGTVRVGASQLDPVVGGPGTTICAGVYNQNYTFFANTCP